MDACAPFCVLVTVFSHLPFGSEFSPVADAVAPSVVIAQPVIEVALAAAAEVAAATPAVAANDAQHVPALAEFDSADLVDAAIASAAAPRLAVAVAK